MASNREEGERRYDLGHDDGAPGDVGNSNGTIEIDTIELLSRTLTIIITIQLTKLKGDGSGTLAQSVTSLYMFQVRPGTPSFS